MPHPHPGLLMTTSTDLSGDSFLSVLHAIVSNESLDSAIHWLPCGTKFIVSDREEFVRLVLSQNYFGVRNGTSATKYTSFTRRLKRWSFTRTPSGRNIGAYHHEYFVRGKPELVKKILLKKWTNRSTSDSTTPQHTLEIKERRRASTGSHYADLHNMPLGQPVDDELNLSIATEKYTSWANANFVNHHVAFSSNKPEPSIDCIYSNSGIVDERTIASSSNPMVMNSHQLLMQQMAKLNQQQQAIQQMQQQMQLQKHQELQRYVTNNSSFASFDTTKTGTFQVPTKMYQDEVPEERGRPKKRATVGALSPGSNMFDAYPFVMNQAYASSYNVANSTSLASITRAQSMGSFKNSDQCPLPRMNLTSSAVASTAKTANFTPSSIDSIRALYHPQPQKQRRGGEERSPSVPEQQPPQNNVDCCDSDGEDSIDALFKDFTYTGPLNDSFQRIMN